MNDLALKIARRIRLDQLNKKKATIGKVMIFDSMGRLNNFVNTKVITKSEAETLYPKGYC